MVFCDVFWVVLYAQNIWYPSTPSIDNLLCADRKFVVYLKNPMRQQIHIFNMVWEVHLVRLRDTTTRNSLFIAPNAIAHQAYVSTGEQKKKNKFILLWHWYIHTYLSLCKHELIAFPFVPASWKYQRPLNHSGDVTLFPYKYFDSLKTYYSCLLKKKRFVLWLVTIT